jgi:hypothetical protein
MLKLNEMVRVSVPPNRTWIVKERYFREDDYRGEYAHVTFEYAPEATGLELAELIDSDLESANYHSLVGFAATLYGLVKDVAGEEKADLFLEKLYDDATLQNLG